MLFAGFAGTLPILSAQSVGQCMVDKFNEANQPKSSLNCTSNDVQLAVYTLSGAPTSCIEGQMVHQALIGEFVATSNERWDVGAFLALDGGTPNDLGGTCYRDYLHPVSADNTDIDLTGGFGPFYNGEIDVDPTDACGDIQQNTHAFLQTQVIDFPCQDSDGDGQADIQTCTVWANSRSDGGGTTGSVVVSAGTNLNPGATHTVDETAGTGTSLADYDTSISCDNGASCSDCTSIDVDVLPDDVVTCTITNQLIDPCLTFDCDDGNACTADSCDGSTGEPVCTNDPGPLNGAACGDASDTVCDNPDSCLEGVCLSNHEPDTSECRAAAGVCDVAEFCDGAGSCPGDSFEPDTTVCRTGSGDICDPEEMCSGTPGDPCPDDGKSTAVCREANGECDVPESCDGASNDCPADESQPDGTPCIDTDGSTCTAPACSGGACQQDYEVVTCRDPGCLVCDPSLGECVPVDPFPDECLVDQICRTPGFFGTHAGMEKQNSQNITQALLDAVGGIQVCGLFLDSSTVDGSNSAVEALCVSVEGDPTLQLIRQLTALSLNCVVSGDGGDCFGLGPSVSSLFDDCNLACVGDQSATRSVQECIDEVDCFNNGGDFVDGFCYLGVCSDNGAYCNSDDLTACDVPSCDPLDTGCEVATCDPIPGNCHDRELCSDPEGDLCFEPPGPAGSPDACNMAISNDCLVNDPASCASP